MNLLKELEVYQPFNEQEEKDKEFMIQFLKTYDNAFQRENKIAHVTSSAWVVNPSRTKVLMAYHNLYDSWAWLGGHNDGCEDCLKVALKEVKEESGVQDVKEVFSSIYSIEVLTVDGHVKKGNYVSSHLHLNVTYLLEADDRQDIFNKEDENSAVGWFDLDKAIAASSEPWFQEHIYKKLNEKLKKI